MKNMKKKVMVVFLLAPFQVLAGSMWDIATPPLTESVQVTVHRSPSCGCCGKWIAHMQRHGFVIKDIKESDMETVKRRAGVPKELESCHTAESGGYVVEGHVPAGDVKRALKAREKLLGLAVPGMPSGSPGMEMGGKMDDFSVLAFDRQGNVEVFSEHRGH